MGMVSVHRQVQRCCRRPAGDSAGPGQPPRRGCAGPENPAAVLLLAAPPRGRAAAACEPAGTRPAGAAALASGPAGSGGRNVWSASPVCAGPGTTTVGGTVNGRRGGRAVPQPEPPCMIVHAGVALCPFFPALRPAHARTTASQMCSSPAPQPLMTSRLPPKRGRASAESAATPRCVSGSCGSRALPACKGGTRSGGLRSLAHGACPAVQRRPSPPCAPAPCQGAVLARARRTGPRQPATRGVLHRPPSCRPAGARCLAPAAGSSRSHAGAAPQPASECCRRR